MNQVSKQVICLNLSTYYSFGPILCMFFLNIHSMGHNQSLQGNLSRGFKHEPNFG